MMKQDSTVGELMSGRWKWLLIVVVALIAGERFVRMPETVMLTSSCEPDSFVNELAAVLPEQWRTAQLQAIAHELDAPRVQAEAMAEITRIEQGLPRPSPADQLRQQAQEIENKKLDALLAPIVAERNSLLRRCFIVTYEKPASGPRNK